MSQSGEGLHQHAEPLGAVYHLKSLHTLDEPGPDTVGVRQRQPGAIPFWNPAQVGEPDVMTNLLLGIGEDGRW